MENEKLIDAIEDCLQYYDVLGLISFGAPCDEYRGEAKLIAEGFLNLRSSFEIQQKLYNVFAQEFAPLKPIPFASFDPVAKDLFDLKHTFGKTYKAR